MKLREMHLINRGDKIVYTSIQEYKKVVISIESSEKEILLVYNKSVAAVIQVDDFEVKELETILIHTQFSRAFDKDIMVLWMN